MQLGKLAIDNVVGAPFVQVVRGNYTVFGILVYTGICTLNRQQKGARNYEVPKIPKYDVFAFISFRKHNENVPRTFSIALYPHHVTKFRMSVDQFLRKIFHQKK